MLAYDMVFGVHFVEHCFLVLKIHFHWQHEVLHLCFGQFTIYFAQETKKKTKYACMQWISWPLEDSHSSVQFFKIGFTRVSASANFPGTVIICVLVLTELREKVLQVDNSEFEFVLAQTPL